MHVQEVHIVFYTISGREREIKQFDAKMSINNIDGPQWDSNYRKHLVIIYQLSINSITGLTKWLISNMKHPHQT